MKEEINQFSELDKRDNLHNLTNQLQALSNVQSEYHSIMSFLNDIRKGLNNSYNLETRKHSQEGVNNVLKLIDSQIDGYSRNSGDISTENYFLKLTTDVLADKIQEGIAQL